MTLRALHGLDVIRTLHGAQGTHLLLLTSPACGACAAVRRALAGMEPIAGLHALEVEAASAPGLVEELEVFHLPAIWLWRDGEALLEVQAEVGAMRDAILRGMGPAHLSHPQPLERHCVQHREHLRRVGVPRGVAAEGPGTQRARSHARRAAP